MAPKPREWMKPEDVEWLKVSQLKLGEGNFGKVFAGRLKLRGKKPISVAVKKFNPSIPITDGRGRIIDRHPFRVEDHLSEYERAVSELKTAGIRIPKIAFVKHEGRTVQVSSIFQKEGKTKIMDARSFVRTGSIAAPQTLRVLTKLIERGYSPHFDSMGFIHNRYGLSPIVFDLDSFVINGPFGASLQVEDWLHTLFPDDASRRKEALETLIDAAKHPEIRQGLLDLKKRRWFAQPP
ncbi:hypothetical protein H0O03_04855 [Candidatus Micrarchaeota archaeon]|nr:hypothetical protein [Candidatus Micrarchaeota archaeon]